MMEKMSKGFVRKAGFILLALCSILLVSQNWNRPTEAKLAGAEPVRGWEILGPGGGGAMFFPTVSPHDANLVLVRCDMTGAYVSKDAGGSWRMFNLRAPVDFFVFDPVDPKVIYAHTVGLWRSTDVGRTWSLVYPDPRNVKEIIKPDDHASERLLTKDGEADHLTALAVDPADSKVLYAARQRGQGSMLLISSDWGKSWKEAALLGPPVRRVYVDPNSPRDNRTLYVVHPNRVVVRENGEWKKGPPVPDIESFTDVTAGFPKGNPKPVIYGVGRTKWKDGRLLGGVYVSTDGGMNWKAANPQIERQARQSPRPPVFQAISTCWTHPEVAYLSYNRLPLGPDSGDVFFGVLKTSDGCNTWKPVWKESTSSAANIHDIWISERFGASWGENPISLGVAPGNPDICYGTDYGRTLQTTDGGLNWQAVYSRRTASGTYTTTGLDVTTCYGVHFDPFNANHLLISYIDIGLFSSEDVGRSWRSSTRGVSGPWVNTTYWVVFDPQVKGRVWGVMSGVHDLSRPKMWRRQSPSRYNGGVCISQDGGMTWQQSTEGMPPTAATHLLLDRRSPAQARTLYVAGFGRGVFKSTDDGRSWALKNEGIQGAEPFAWRLAMDREGTLYLVVARKTEDGRYGNEGDGALYRSRDGAGHWERLSLPEGVNGPNGLEVDPDNPKRLYLATWGRNTPDGAVSGGIFLSTDAGQSWRSVLDRDQHVYDVTVDIGNPHILYACGFESSAWRSEDRGETWKRIRGYNFKWGHRVIPDPKDTNKIYITTFGGSVWHGPARGDPSAIEDIVTPEVAYSR